MTFQKAVDKYGSSLSLPVSGAVLDNTIANPSSVTVPGRYLVPSVGTSGVFVGQGGKFGDFNGESWVFTSPLENDSVLITTGPNAGKLATFSGGTWTSKSLGGTITLQSSSTTKPAGASSGDTLLVTLDGTTSTTVTEEWKYTGTVWVQVIGATPVSGSVLDNTIADPTMITTVGRYIVPATGTSGVFVGNENRYADYDGTTFTFTSATSGQTVLINTGTNSGQLYKYNGATWAQASGSALSAYNWTLASSYKATNLVIYNNNWYQANGDVPSNTAFTVGTTGATWKQIGVSPGDYIYVVRATSDQGSVNPGSTLTFNKTVRTTGGIAYNSSIGVFTLKAGVTYKLEANVAFGPFTDTSNGYISFNWCDASTNTPLSDVARGVANPVVRNAAETSQTFAGGLYTPATNQTIKLRADATSGTASLRMDMSSASITQIAPAPTTLTFIPTTNTSVLTIGAVNTAPTKATTRVRDRITVTSDGSGWSECVVEYFHNSSTGATVGSGVYTFQLPPGVFFDSSYYSGLFGSQRSNPSADLTTSDLHLAIQATGRAWINGSAQQVDIIPYQAQTFTIVGHGDSEGGSGLVSWRQLSSSYFGYTASLFGLTLRFRFKSA